MSIVADSSLGPASPFDGASPVGTRLTGQPTHRLELHVHSGDDYAIVDIWGELYTGRLGDLTRLLDGLIRAGRTRVVLDVSRLYDLDGDAIAELTRWQAAFTASGGLLWLASPRPWVRRLIEHMCLRGTFTVYPTVQKALAALDSSVSQRI